MLFPEEAADGFNDGGADIIQRIHLICCRHITGSNGAGGIMESVPRAISTRQRLCSAFTDMADAQRIDQPVKRDGAPRLDRIKQLLCTCLAVAIAILQLRQIGRIARGKREDVGWLADRKSRVVIKILDLLLTQAINVKGAP